MYHENNRQFSVHSSQFDHNTYIYLIIQFWYASAIYQARQFSRAMDRILARRPALRKKPKSQRDPNVDVGVYLYPAVLIVYGLNINCLRSEVPSSYL